MTQQHFFKHARWVGAADRSPDTFSVLRAHFSLRSVKKVSLRVLGLGFFKCYINGVCINPDTFLPLSSDFEGSCDPKGEILTGHRVYVPQFDVTPHAREGDNIIALHFGGGWYTHRCRVFGLPKAIWCITAETEDGTEEFVSDERCRIGDGLIEQYNFIQSERQSPPERRACLGVDFDDGDWSFATLTEPLDTEYCTTDCPADALIEQIPVRRILSVENRAVYDCGRNLTGYPVLAINAARGETVEVFFSEGRLANGELDPAHAHKQTFGIVSDGSTCMAQPEFTWFGFRFFEVRGNAEPLCVKLIHANVQKNSSFQCDSEVLNWTYETFLHTMLCNMHTGHPCDCPHLERRGYTGDGQLTCHAVLSTLDARAFYEKWMRDIADCQDVLSGHVQYTAPYILSGGGPGGWGSAIVEVPYQLYRHFGDTRILSDHYDAMRRYIDYLDAHSEFGLVTSDQPGVWCLGDWCGPNILYPDKDICSHNQQVVIPAPLVNTYFAARSLEKLCRIARVIGRDADVSEYEEKLALRKKAIRAAYFNTFDGNFVMNVQGANAFAVDLGLGDRRTYDNMVHYYQKLGCFDTGIFATDVLTRVLFERGNAELAVDLLTGNGNQGFAHWMQNGATTFHEYWDSNRSRSHSHPMFGAPVAYFFEHLLGIGQAENSCAYADLLIEPKATSRFSHMSGSLCTPRGDLSLSYTKDGEGIRFLITLPPHTRATLRFGGCDHVLNEGKNELVLAN